MTCSQDLERHRRGPWGAWGAEGSSEPAPPAWGPHGWEVVCAWHAVCLSVVTGLEGGPAHLPTRWGTASGPRGHAAAAPALQAHTDSLNTLVALHQLYQYTQKYYDEVGGRASLGTAGSSGAPSPGLWSDVTRPPPTPQPRSSMPWRRTPPHRRCSWPFGSSRSQLRLRTKSRTSDLQPPASRSGTQVCDARGQVLGSPGGRGPAGRTHPFSLLQRSSPGLPSVCGGGSPPQSL